MISARLNTENMEIICCTPGWCSDAELLENSPNYNHATQDDFEEYGLIVKNLSEKYGFKCCEWYKTMNKTSYLMAEDGYHPNDNGHWVLACEIFQVIKAGNSY